MPAFCGAAIGPVRPGCRDFMRNFREMEVCPDNMLPYILTGVIVFIVALVIGIPLGILYRKKVAEKEILSAEEEAKRIINEAIKSAESKKREALVEAKEKILAEKTNYERGAKERRSELQEQERRLQQKEETLERKLENVERKEESYAARLANLEEARTKVAKLQAEQMETLERISGYTAEEAKAYLIAKLETEVTHEAAMKIKEVEARFKEEADAKAKEIVGLAIQRCAADHVAEATVSVVPLPNDEMKGRIIGREGRNIRTLETLTGVDLIIDDTPEAITVSCFDPVRREIARLALEKLILDGRIHPARIEEMVEIAKREVDATIKAEGERAVLETNVMGLHPELIKLHRPHEVPHQLRPKRATTTPSKWPSWPALWPPRLGRMWPPPSGPACSTTWARLWTTRWRAPTSPSAWSWPGSTRRAKRWSMPSTPTTTT